MSNININIEGVNYAIDLNTLHNHVDFSIINGRRFVLEGKNKDGEIVQGNLKLNDIFEQILKKHPKIDHKKLTNFYRELKTAGYERQSLISIIVSCVHRVFKSDDRQRIDQMMLNEEKAVFKEKITAAPDLPDLNAETLEKSLKLKTSKNYKTITGEVHVGSGRYLLRPGQESLAEAKNFPSLPEAMQKANYVVNLIEGDNKHNPFKEDIPSTNAKVVNFKNWRDEAPPGADIIELARDVVANSNIDKPDMVFCRQGLQRTSTFVAIAELIRNEDCWEQDASNNIARKVIVTVLQEMASQDNGRIPTKSQLATLLSDEFIDSIRSKPKPPLPNHLVLKKELLNFARNSNLDPGSAKSLIEKANKIETDQHTRKSIDNIYSITTHIAILRHNFLSFEDGDKRLPLLGAAQELLKKLNNELEKSPVKSTYEILDDLNRFEKKIKKMIEYKPNSMGELDQIKQGIARCDLLIKELSLDPLNEETEQKLNVLKKSLEDHKNNLKLIAL